MSSDPSAGRTGGVAQLRVGAHLLTVGLPSGTLVVCAVDAGTRVGATELDVAFGREPWTAEPEHGAEAPAPDDEELRDPLAVAETVTDRAERVGDLARRIVEGDLIDQQLLLDESGRLLAFAEKRVGEGRAREALLIARRVHTALALARRWIELLRMLRRLFAAVEARLRAHPHEQAELDRLRAWILHERGSLELVAGKELARSHLCQAMRMRSRIGDTIGAAASRQNLALLAVGCGWRPRRRHLIAALTALALLLLLSAALGSTYADSGRSTPPLADREPPTITIASPLSRAYREARPLAIRFGCSDPSGVVRCAATLDLRPVRSGTSVTPARGSHQLVVRAEDGTGNEIAETRRFSVVARPAETTPPTITIASPSDERYTEASRVVARYTCSDSSGVASCSGRVGGVPVPNGGVVPTAPPGVHHLVVTAVDRFGNRATKQHRYTVVPSPPQDHDPPVITIASPSPRTYANGLDVRASYRCADASRVVQCLATVDGRPIPDGSPIPTDAEGEHRFLVEARDVYGNGTTSSRLYRVGPPQHDAPPTVTISDPKNGGTYQEGTRLAAGFSCDDDRAVASCTATVSCASVAGGGTCGTVPQAVADGGGLPSSSIDGQATTYQVEVVAVDSSGQQGRGSATYTIEPPVDTTSSTADTTVR